MILTRQGVRNSELISKTAYLCARRYFGLEDGPNFHILKN